MKMLYCRKCRVNVHGDKHCCPLCKGELTGEPDENVFPSVTKEKFSRTFALRVVSFIAVTIIILAFTVNLLIHRETWWSLIVAAATACLWVSVSSAIIQRRHIFAAITWQLIFISGAMVLWDLSMGWLGWSIDYVIPCACIASMMSMLVLSKIMKTPPEERLLYLALDAIYGIVPVIFIFTDVLSNIYPSAICVCASLISIAAIILFEGRSIAEQITKKFHL